MPVGARGQAEFLGELFHSPIVTRVTLTLGTDVLFSFDGVHFHSGTQPDDPANGHNLAVTDDFVFAEPVATTASQPAVAATENTAFNGPVGTFSDALMDEAKRRGWVVISMKKEWNRIFAFEK